MLFTDITIERYMMLFDDKEKNDFPIFTVAAEMLIQLISSRHKFK